MVFIEESKVWRLVPRKVDEGIAFMPLDEFFDCLGYVEEDAVWWLFEMKDLVGGVDLR